MSHGRGEDDVPIQIDGYRIKARISPGKREERPESWKEVGNRVNRSLMALAAGLPTLAADVVEGASNIVRGIANLPAAIARRIQAGREQADAREGRAQEQLEAGELPPSPEEALRQLEAVRERIRVQGLTAEIAIREDGTPVMILGRPELKELAGEVAKALPTSSDEAKRPTR